MPGELKQILDQTKQMKVLVIGDLILDEYLWGTVSRISPEAPVPILGFKSENKVLGGAANVANNLRALGCEVHLCGVVGEDEKGKQILGLLREKGIHCDGVMIDSSRPTIHKLRVIAHSQQMLRIDRELKSPIQSGVLQKAVQYLTEVIPRLDGIICSDYQKGFLTKELLNIIVKEAKKERIRVALDPKGSDYSRYKGVDAITPNLQEVKDATRLEIANENELDLAVGKVFAITESRLILVTQGAEGMTLYENGKSKTRIPAEAREVYDVTGAGDTVIAVFGLGLFGDVDFVDAAKLANKAAGIVVGKVGTATVSGEELSHYLEDGPSLQGRKIINLDECGQVLSRARNHGKKIVFTNGCFDLLHIGHIKYLQEAKKHGDLLVIGLNDDESVRQIKGPERPIVGEAERARILAALDCVDYVVLFSESTPERVLGELRPDVLVKGADYSLDQVVGRDIVEGYGGRIELIPLVPGQSTSRLVRSIIEKYGQSR